MKKTTKTALIIAACLILIGLLFFGGALVMAGGDFSKIGNEKMKTEEIVIDEFFHSLSVRSHREDIAVLPSEDGKCRVVFYEPEKYEGSASVLDKMLTIEVKEPQNWLERFTLFNFVSPKITLYLPKSEYSMFAVKESTGDISIPEGFTFERIQISTGTGDVSCAASAKDWIEIKTTTGDIRLGGLSAGSVDLSVTTGKVEIRSVDCRDTLRMDTGTGETSMTDVACGSLDAEGSTGRLTMKNVIAAGRMTLSRSTGDIRFEACDAAELSIRTGTGDVIGSLLSAKHFKAKSSTGKIDVPDRSADSQCEVTTTTGSIQITCP